MTTNYVNNQEFNEALAAYKQELKENPDAQIPEYIGRCILDIANRFSMRPNFYGYSYRDEMVSDAVENCLMYVGNYDPTRGTSAFSYFTQICFYAFLRRIQREKKQSYIKHQLVKEMPMEAFDTQGHDDTDYASSYVAYVQSNSTFDGEAFERSMNKPKKKKGPTGLEKLMEDDNDTEAV